MTKLHKIDREKLAEVLNMRRKDMDANEFDLLKEAAENWLKLTDPGFDIPDEVLSDVGCCGDQSEPKDVEHRQWFRDIFKALFAKAGE